MIRIQALLEKLNQQNIDGIIVHDAMNRRYLSGFTGSSGYLYISKNKNVIVTDFRYIEQASKQCRDFEVIDQGPLGVFSTLLKVISEEGSHQIGFEANNVSYADYLDLKLALTNVSLIDTRDFVETIRMIKDENELSNIKEAANIADLAFEHILSLLTIGITETDIALEIEYYMKKHGAQGLSFDTIVASGANSSLCHATPTHKKVQVGDFITMDFGCIYEGYCSDMTRTVVMGKASEAQKKVYNTVLRAQEEALAIIKAGLSGKEVDAVARDIISAEGYGDYFGHGLGHSLGLEVHESPRLSPKGLQLLENNMMVTVEPGIYIPDFGGVRIEDLICVKLDGYENFTKSEKALLEL